MKRSKNKNHAMPVPKGMYAWNAIHAGSFLLHVETLINCHKFVFLPGPEEYFLTYEDFEEGINKRVLEFVEVLPDEIYEEAIALSCPPSRTSIQS